MSRLKRHFPEDVVKKLAELKYIPDLFKEKGLTNRELSKVFYGKDTSDSTIHYVLNDEKNQPIIQTVIHFPTKANIDTQTYGNYNDSRTTEKSNVCDKNTHKEINPYVFHIKPPKFNSK